MGSGGSVPSASAASRQMWLQRWVDAGLITRAQAESVDHYEEVNAAALAPYDRGTADEILAGWIHRWTVVGYLTAAQAEAVNRDIAFAMQPAAFPPPTVAPSAGVAGAPSTGGGFKLAVLSEVLGYVGAALAIGASFWLMRNVWPNMDRSVQLGISGIAAVAFTAFGFLIRVHGVAAFARLRTVVWLASTAVTGALGAVVAIQYLPTTSSSAITAVVAAFITVQSVGLWQFRTRPAHQITALGGLVVAVWAGMSAASTDAATGLTLFVLGLALLGLGSIRVVRISEITLSFGAATLVLATIPFAQGVVSFGLVYGCIVCGVLVLVGLLKAVPLNAARRTVLCVVGTAGGILTGFSTYVYFVGDGALGLGLVILGLGVVVLALAATRQLVIAEPGEIAGSGLIIVGIATLGTDHVAAAPLLGIAVSIVGVVIGLRTKRPVLTVMGWIGLAFFGLWELIWIGQHVNTGAVFALITGAILVGAAVFLNRMVSRSRRTVPEPTTQPAPPAPTADPREAPPWSR